MSGVIDSAGRHGSALIMPPRHQTYLEIANDLERRIRLGEYPPGSKLPSYGEAAKLYSVSVSTAQHAFRELRSRGFTEGVLGVGIFVVDPLPGR